MSSPRYEHAGAILEAVARAHSPTPDYLRRSIASTRFDPKAAVAIFLLDVDTECDDSEIREMFGIGQLRLDKLRADADMLFGKLARLRYLTFDIRDVVYNLMQERGVSDAEEATRQELETPNWEGAAGAVPFDLSEKAHRILDAVCAAGRTTFAALESGERHREVAAPRSVAFLMLYAETEMTNNAVANLFCRSAASATQGRRQLVDDVRRRPEKLHCSVFRRACKLLGLDPDDVIEQVPVSGPLALP